ncbi:hypothetical protein IEQ34_014793 [Dendrobium chrysotoxum]|uniref:Uncharacterized protein n=1 Tax=Dendrobium chrysotoxum TaxID=161865 RepID=A0AAV7GK38_DENCH|nr:hypothetical protein IEQ34_014793 [Dendrobium chrysotoxum]
MSFSTVWVVPKYYGHDNLALFYVDPGYDALKGQTLRLNDFFRARIDEEDFTIRCLPYHVIMEQTYFSLDVDLS